MDATNSQDIYSLNKEYNINFQYIINSLTQIKNMKQLSIIVFLSLLFTTSSFSQSEADKAEVTKACMNYLEGFYEGDTSKIIACLKPTLHKYGFWKSKKTGKYEGANYMTFEEAKTYATNVLKKKQFPKTSAPKKVVVLDVMNHIAVAKITAWWGEDYLLLSRVGDKWMIEQALWEGPLGK